MWDDFTDYLSDPTGVKREREGYKKKVAAENERMREARGRVEDLSQGYLDTADELSRGYDFIAGRAPGDVARLGELSTQARPTYGGAGFTGTVQNYLDPSMAFQQEEARKQIQAGAAAQGNLLSGKAQKELADRAQQLAQKDYADAFQRMRQDRDYATNEARYTHEGDVAGYQDLYNRQRDITGLSLGGLNTQTDLGKWGTGQYISTRVPYEGKTEGTAAGYGDMLRGRQYGDFTSGIFDIGGDVAKTYFGGKF
jgi:hypothetical protein